MLVTRTVAARELKIPVSTITYRLATGLITSHFQGGVILVDIDEVAKVFKERQRPYYKIEQPKSSDMFA